MNPNQEQKLNTLIASSPILNASERAEWLALLELMNDKQLGELEKILVLNQNTVSSAQQAVGTQAIKQINNLAGQNTANNKQPATNNTPVAPAKQLPHLSHIMNLPKHWSEKPVASAKQTVDSKKVNQPIVNKEKAGFAKKLKNIFAEKELTTSQPNFPLEITEHSQSMPMPLPVKNIEVETPSVHLPEKPITPPVVAKVELPVAKPVVPTPKVAPVIIPKSKPVWLPNKTLGPTGDKFAPGVNYKKDSEKSRIETLENVKKHVVEKGDLTEEIQESNIPQNKNINFNAIADLKGITIEFLETSDLLTMVNKIKQLIVKYGYFDVIFSLEASPAYKSYIATGLKLMVGDEPGGEIIKEKMLTKQDFEKFADLLAKIQAT